MVGIVALEQEEKLTEDFLPPPMPLFKLNSKQHEIFTAFENIEYRPIKTVAYAYAVYVFIANLYGASNEIYAFGLFLAFLASIMYVLLKKSNVMDLCITFCGTLYVCMCFNYIIMTADRLKAGNLYVW